MKSLGNIIKDLRRRKGVEAKEMAEALGLSRTYVSQIENDKKIPSRILLTEIAKYFNIPASALYLELLKAEDFKNQKNFEIFESFKPLIQEITTLSLPINKSFNSQSEIKASELSKDSKKKNQKRENHALSS